jgi:hypothetical protein
MERRRHSKYGTLAPFAGHAIMSFYTIVDAICLNASSPLVTLNFQGEAGAGGDARADFDHQSRIANLDSRRSADSRPTAVHAGGGGGSDWRRYTCAGRDDGCDCLKPGLEWSKSGAGFGISLERRPQLPATATPTWGGDPHQKGSHCGRGRSVSIGSSHDFPRTRPSRAPRTPGAASRVQRKGSRR